MMKKAVDPETKEIIDSFVAEGYERLDDAEVQMEKVGCTDDSDCLGSVFRLFHSVKGSAGYLGFENVKLLTHEAETLLDLFIKKKTGVEPEAIDLILRTIDALRSMIRLVERENGDETASKIAAAAPRRSAPTSARRRLRCFGHYPVRGRRRGGAPRPPNKIELSELVSSEMVERFLAECADLVDEVERLALGLAIPRSAQAPPDSESVNDIFRAVHTVKGNSGFFGYALLETACMGLESQLDRARKGEAPLNEALVNSVIERVDQIRSAISRSSSWTIPARRCFARCGRSRRCARSRGGKGGGAQARRESAPTAGGYRPLGEILVDMGAVAKDEVTRALAQQERPIGEILVESGAANHELVAQALEIQRVSGPALPNRANASPWTRSSAKKSASTPRSSTSSSSSSANSSPRNPWCSTARTSRASSSTTSPNPSPASTRSAATSKRRR